MLDHVTGCSAERVEGAVKIDANDLAPSFGSHFDKRHLFPAAADPSICEDAMKISKLLDGFGKSAFNLRFVGHVAKHRLDLRSMRG